jgi:hypothetical protein
LKKTRGSRKKEEEKDGVEVNEKIIIMKKSKANY